ncbi:hypothetical protein N7454_006852 [Penicillium verhagenii]|nr:hypothetical protein N7454_006852 [Penicillium verhagenii]
MPVVNLITFAYILAAAVPCETVIQNKFLRPESTLMEDTGWALSSLVSLSPQSRDTEDLKLQERETQDGMDVHP